MIVVQHITPACCGLGSLATEAERSASKFIPIDIICIICHIFAYKYRRLDHENNS
jgi:hypothetical protein